MAELYWHFVVGTAIKYPAGFFFVSPPPLLEEKGNPKSFALIPDIEYP